MVLFYRCSFFSSRVKWFENTTVIYSFRVLNVHTFRMTKYNLVYVLRYKILMWRHLFLYGRSGEILTFIYNLMRWENKTQNSCGVLNGSLMNIYFKLILSLPLNKYITFFALRYKCNPWLFSLQMARRHLIPRKYKFIEYEFQRFFYFWFSFYLPNRTTLHGWQLVHWFIRYMSLVQTSHVCVQLLPLSPWRSCLLECSYIV